MKPMADTTSGGGLGGQDGSPGVMNAGADDQPAHSHPGVSCPEGTTGKDVLNMPQYYPSEMPYQKDALFTRITMRNFGDYRVLGQDLYRTYAIDPQHTMGFAFDNDDIEKRPSLGMLPAMSLRLRDSGIKTWKQAYRLRIRHAFAMKGVATSWYISYTQRFGGLVSDFEHLEGGKALWKSFVRTAAERGLSISVVDTASGQSKPVSEATTDDEIWSVDAALKGHVLVLEKPV